MAETLSLCGNVKLAVFRELVMMRFDLHQPVLIWLV